MQLLAFAAVMVAVPPVDRAWTEWLVDHRQPAFTDWMRRTVFEGHWPGASDLPMLFLLAVSLGYFWCVRRGATPRERGLQPVLGYLFVTALVSGLAVVHSLKWVLGRARPFEVLASAGMPYSPWYAFGPHYVAEGAYGGSFPSGHTAAVFVLLGLAYALAGDPLLRRPWKTLGWLVGALVLLDTVAMTVANCMARSHWLSDGLGSVLLLWPIMHALYFWVLAVPEQRRAATRRGSRVPPAGRAWEGWMVWYGLLVDVGLVLVLLGLRAPWVQSPPVLLALIVPGAVAIALFLPRLHSVYRDFRRGVRGRA